MMFSLSDRKKRKEHHHQRASKKGFWGQKRTAPCRWAGNRKELAVLAGVPYGRVCYYLNSISKHSNRANELLNKEL